MKKIFFTLILACASLLAFAQEEKQASQQPVSKEVAAIRTANNLAKYGYENYSASALLEAARILAETPTQELAPESSTKGGTVSTSDSKSGKPEFTPVTLLADAKKFADGDATLLALATQVEKSITETTSRGRLGGPGKNVERVNANSTDTYVIAFKYGVLAEIFVSGDGDTDLDLYVYDENGRSIELDDDYSDDCYVSWVPAWTGNFVVKVVNRGRVYNEYILLTN